MDDLFNMLSQSARFDKSKNKKKKQQEEESTRNTALDLSLHPSSKFGTRSDDRDLGTAVGTTSGTKDHDDDDDDDDDDSSSSASDDGKDGDGDGGGLNLGLNRTQKARKEKHRGHEKKSVAKQEQIHQEEVNAFRNRMNICLSKQSKFGCPDPITSFRDIQCPSWWCKKDDNKNDTNTQAQYLLRDFQASHSAILGNIEQGKWVEPTPIQMQCLPILLERRDLVGAAPTGSGKSGAFIIPALLLASVNNAVYHGDSKANNDEDVKDNNNTTHSKKEKETKKNRKGRKNKGGENSQDTNSEHSSEGEIRTLLLAPSRELATQLHREVERLGLGKYGGIKTALLSKSNAANFSAGKLGGKQGLDVLITTPLRLLSCMETAQKEGSESALKRGMSGIRLVVLDEADRLLDASDGQGGGSNNSNDREANNNDKQQSQSGSAHVKSFVEQIDEILAGCPASAVRALFSATIGPHVRQLAESILRNPVDVQIRPKSKAGAPGGIAGNPDIDQKLVFVGREEGKLLAIRQLVQKGIKPPVIIFLESKDRAQALFGELMYDGINVDVIHAGRTQSARDKAVQNFRKGDTWVLICTDLCARGVDFKAVNVVINYDLPSSGVTYVHRIGRTGRAGRKGEAITFFTEDDFENLRTIANVMKLSGCEVPAWMLSLKQTKGRKRNQTEQSTPQRRGRIDTTSSYDKQKRTKKLQSIQASKRRKQLEQGAAAKSEH
jgi:ATP-dependent RNA helicase DDX52/ROK1